MIRHHEGAGHGPTFAPGSAYDPLLYEFIGDVKNDQMVEIERMNALLVTLSDDLAPTSTWPYRCRYRHQKHDLSGVTAQASWLCRSQ